MKKAWIVSSVLFLALSVAAQTGSSGSSQNQTGAQSGTSANQTSPSSANPAGQTGSTNSQTQKGNASQSQAPSQSPQSGSKGAAGEQGNATGQNSGKLPQTASPLPLLALLGVGSLVAGIIKRKR